MSGINEDVYEVRADFINNDEILLWNINDDDITKQSG